MKVFSIGVVGAGVIARQVHLPVLRSMQNVRVAWIADADPARARAAADANGIEYVSVPASAEQLPACDVVLLAIPVGVRRPYYEGLARRNIAVFAEKPFATTAAEHRSGMSLFRPERVACGYMRRMYASSLLLKSVIAHNIFGPVRRVRIREGARTTKTGLDHSHYDDVRVAGGGVLISLGCHAVDLALQVTGANRFEVLHSRLILDDIVDRKVESSVTLERVTRPEGLGSRPDLSCLLELTVSWLDEQPNTLEVEFDGAVLSTSLQPAGVIRVSPAKQASQSATVEVGDNITAESRFERLELELRHDVGARTTNQAFYLEWMEFLQGLEQGRPSGVAAETSLLTAELIDKLYDCGGVDRSIGQVPQAVRGIAEIGL